MKRIVLVGIAVMMIVNIVAGALIFLDIRLFQIPETTVRIDLIEANPEEAVLKLAVKMENPNHFEVLVKDLELVAESGNRTSRALIKDGSIPPLESKVFTAIAYIRFNNTQEFLKSKIRGEVGANFFGFIKKTLPIDISIITSIKNAIQSLSSPLLHVGIDFGEITQESVNVTVGIDIHNPNTFEIYIKNFLVDIETKNGENVGNITIDGGLVAAKGSLKCKGKGRILLKALGSEQLTIKGEGRVGARVASLNKSMPFHINAKINVPDLSTLLSDMPTGVVIRGDYSASLRGFVNHLTFEVNNPNKIAFFAKSIKVCIYRVDGDRERLIAEGSLGKGIIKAEGVTTFEGRLLIPYHRLLFPRVTADWLKVDLRAEVVLPIFNYSVELGVTGYHDLRLFS